MGLLEKLQKRKLAQLDPSDLETIPHRNRWVLARVLDVYDGDTITVVYFCGGTMGIGKHPYRTNIRIHGIDTPERRGAGVSKLEKLAAQATTDYAEALLGGWVYVRPLKHDKYGGRMIGAIKYTDPSTRSQLDYADHMLEIGAAKPYDGGKKELWTPKELKKIVQSLSK